MGLFGDLIDVLMGRKVHDDCEKPEEMTDDEVLEAMIYFDRQMKKEKKSNRNHNK